MFKIIAVSCDLKTEMFSEGVLNDFCLNKIVTGHTRILSGQWGNILDRFFGMLCFLRSRRGEAGLAPSTMFHVVLH
jgi:hypothetical protein